MKFKYLNIIMLILLIGLASATTTITLNSPSNGASSFNNNFLFNSTSSENATLFIQNISLWTNSTGTWQRNLTNNYTVGYDLSPITTINSNKWYSVIAGSGTTLDATTIPNTIFGAANNAGTGSTTGSVTLISNNFTTNNLGNNYTINVRFMAASDSTPARGDVRLTLLGTNVLVYSKQSGVQTEDHNWTIEPFGNNQYNIYKDNVFNVSINATNNTLEFYVFGLSGNGGSSGRGQANFSIREVRVNTTKNKTWVFNQSLLDTYTKWGIETCTNNSVCTFSSNNTLNLYTNNITISQITPINLSRQLNGANTYFSWTSTTPYSTLVNTTLWIDNVINETINISGLSNSTTTNKILTNNGQHSWIITTCGIAYCTNSSTNYFNITKLILNSISYSPSVLSGEAITIIANVSLSSEPTSLYLNYNNQNYTPSVTSGTNYYILTNSLNAPSVGANTNISIYYLANVGGTLYTTQTNNQTVQVVNVTTNCSAGNFRFINITNFDEQTLASINGTVEYTLQVLSNTGLTVNLLNGSATANNISLCSNINLTNANSTYSLQLRYYGQAITNVSFGNYSYETYNIQSMNMSNIPYTIPLYFLDNVTGVKFRVAYKDFYYLTHPNALIQIQRQYLGENLYRVVELPVIGSDGYAYASFNQNNVRYKIIVIENGVTIDTFNDQFPVCQNVVLGTCDLELRGVEGSSTATTSDFSYTLTSTNNSLSLTFTIPSGTPRTIYFATNQSSRFIQGLATCNNSVYGSGGTLTCSYNNTIGDSIVQIQIDGTGEGTLYGSYNVPEDLSSFFLLNNYVIAFILLLSLVIMFIASEKMMMIMSGVGIIYLGVIFLIKGVGLTTIATSIVWLLIAIIIAIYDISKKEDKT